jgi:Ca2+-binding EF-hand superfamily protein
MINGIGARGSYGGPDFQAIRQNRFKKADADGDGKVTKDELSNVLPKNGKGPSVDQIFAKVDTNQDGVIDQSEETAAASQAHGHHHHHGGGAPAVSKLADDIFKAADSDDDGKITKDELTTALSKTDSEGKADDLLKAFDADGDGSITKAELTSTLQSIFPGAQGRAHNAPTGYTSTGVGTTTGTTTTPITGTSTETTGISQPGGTLSLTA